MFYSISPKVEGVVYTFVFSSGKCLIVTNHREVKVNLLTVLSRVIIWQNFGSTFYVLLFSYWNELKTNKIVWNRSWWKGKAKPRYVLRKICQFFTVEHCFTIGQTVLYGIKVSKSEFSKTVVNSSYKVPCIHVHLCCMDEWVRRRMKTDIQERRDMLQSVSWNYLSLWNILKIFFAVFCYICLKLELQNLWREKFGVIFIYSFDY